VSKVWATVKDRSRCDAIRPQQADAALVVEPTVDERQLGRIGLDIDLRQYCDGHGRASFHVTGAAHSLVGGSAWEPTPWRAVQAAAWQTL
jgi:hypothetical protein